jgi:hypothetical protein
MLCRAVLRSFWPAPSRQVRGARPGELARGGGGARHAVPLAAQAGAGPAAPALQLPAGQVLPGWRRWRRALRGPPCLACTLAACLQRPLFSPLSSCRCCSLAAAAPGLEARLHTCATWLQLHGMVQGMAASGELARAAAAAALRSTAQQAVQRTAASGGGGGGGRAARQAGRPGAAGSPAAAAVARSRSAVGASPGGSGAAKPPPAKRQVRSSPAAAAAAAASVQQAAGGQAARGAQAAGLHAAGTVGTSSLPSGVWRAHTTLSLDGGQRPSGERCWEAALRHSTVLLRPGWRAWAQLGGTRSLR